MKKLQFFVFLITTTLILNSCGTVKKAMDPQRKDNSDEFLVKKKSPLSIPPDFEILPVPKDQKMDNLENKEDDFKELIVNSQSNNSEIKNNSGNNVGTFEESLIEKIKNN